MEGLALLQREMEKGLLKWYDFVPDSSVLYIGGGNDPLAEELSDKGLEVTCVRLKDIVDKNLIKSYKQSFRYIVSITDLERLFSPNEALKMWQTLLSADGTLLLGMQNRLGLRYFCGDSDPYTNRVFDGVEHYRNTFWRHESYYVGRMYSKPEIEDMLVEAGIKKFRFFSVFSDIKLPTLIYADDYLPKEELFTRVYPVYNSTDTVFLDEEALYDDLVKTGMLHSMAAAYLIECSAKGNFSEIEQVTLSLMRGEEHARITVIDKFGFVEKRAVYPTGVAGLKVLDGNMRDLREHGIKVIDGEIVGNVYRMPYIDAEVGQLYLKKLFVKDQDAFLRELDKFSRMILSSSDIIREDKGDGLGAVLQRGYLDLVPLNSFHINDEYMFYDQEFYEDHYPANALLWRMIMTLYSWDHGSYQFIPQEVLFDRYGLTAYRDRWENMERDFIGKLRQDDLWAEFRKTRQKNEATLAANRKRMNFSTATFAKLTTNPLQNLANRKLILFGSGECAKKFLTLYGKEYPVYVMVDNNQKRWETEVNGTIVKSPEILRRLNPSDYIVLICAKNYLPIVHQLNNWKISSYGIYDMTQDYPLPSIKKEIKEKTQITNCKAKKKYHVGYIAGVFDLFHIGHLNIFRRAKAECDYLIAGVVTDEGVRLHKKVEPFVPFNERLEIVDSCKYVDKAVEIPLIYCDTWDAWRMYHFDVQFSGSDYEHDEYWQKKKKFLEEHGSTMVFFSYTESTSSSKLKALIDKELINYTM